MRALGGLVGILVVALIGVLIYRNYLASGPSAATTTPIETVDAVGAQTDLLAIAQAERIYQAQQSKYASLDQLLSEGALAMGKPARPGYTFEVNASDSNFQAVARCTPPPLPGCHNYSVDQTMTVQVEP